MPLSKLGSLVALILSAQLAMAQNLIDEPEPLLPSGPAVAPMDVRPSTPSPVPILSSPPANSFEVPQTAVTSRPTLASPEWVHASTSYYWFRPEYLHWRIRPAPLPVALISTGPAGAPNAGVLGFTGTSVLLGGESVAIGDQNGGRLTLGLWLDTDQTVGLELTGFGLETMVENAQFRSDANGAPLLSVPVVNAITGKEESSPITVPGNLAGSAFFTTTSQLWGADLDVLCSSFRHSDLRMNWLIGLRYLGLRERLAFFENYTPLGGNKVKFNLQDVSAPSSITVADRFDTSNQFFGGQFGAQLERCRGRLFFVGTAKLALGGNHQVVNVNGSSSLITPGQPTQVVPGGLLALRSNSGREISNYFSVVPEVGLRVGWQINHRLSATAGYSFLYWTNVVRPGNQIDRTVNASLVPTTAGFGQGDPNVLRPSLSVERSDLWIHGLTIGLEYRR